MRNDSDLRAALREALGEAPPSAPADGEHPDGDGLIAYRLGRLPSAEAERVQDHLVACTACRQDLLDLDALVRAPQATSDSVADLETAVAWRSFRTPPAATRAPAATVQLAALFAVVALGLGGLALHQRSTARQLERELVALAEPRLDVQLVLLPASGERGAPEHADLAEAIGDAPIFWLEVEPPQLLDAYRVEIVDASGVVRWSEETTRSGETFLVYLTRRYLPGERYRLRIFDPTRSGDAPIKEWPLTLPPRNGP